MKKTYTILVLTGCTICATAQNFKNAVATDNPGVAVPVAVNVRSDHGLEEYVNKVSTKAARDFEKNFKPSGDEQWYEMPYGFRATFQSNDITYRVDYDKKGNRLDVLRIYNEKSLSSTIRSMVKTVYYDYSITLIEEITRKNQITYIIHLEGESEWINVRIQNREMEEWQRFNKAS